jgi:hypothetical protein
VADFPHLYVAEAFAPCGCGFPEDLPNRKARKLEPEAQVTMERLSQSLQPAVKGRPRVKMLLTCLPDDEEQAHAERTVTLADLRDPAFRFRTHEMLTVVKEP